METYDLVVDWLLRGWDTQHRIAFFVGLAAGLTLSVMGAHGVAELGAMGAAVVLRWALWQIPPPGRSVAAGTPDDAGSRLGQLAVAVLLVVLPVDLLLAPLQ